MFFLGPKKILSELRKFLGYSFDAENWDLSIYEVFRAIPALFHRFWSRYFYFPSSFLPWFLYSVWRLRSQNPILRWFSTPKKSKNSHAKKIKIKFLHEKKEFFFSDFFYIKHKVSAFQRNQLELLGVSGSETARETKQWPPPEHSSLEFGSWFLNQ